MHIPPFDKKGTKIVNDTALFRYIDTLNNLMNDLKVSRTLHLLLIYWTRCSLMNHTTKQGGSILTLSMNGRLKIDTVLGTQAK
jgi:hypothetical protein